MLQTNIIVISNLQLWVWPKNLFGPTIQVQARLSKPA